MYSSVIGKERQLHLLRDADMSNLHFSMFHNMDGESQSVVADDIHSSYHIWEYVVFSLLKTTDDSLPVRSQ